MNDELKMMFNAIIEEIGRVESKMNARFDKIDLKLDSMQHEINACKLEGGTLEILLRKIDQLEKRIEELEQRTA